MHSRRTLIPALLVAVLLIQRSTFADAPKKKPVDDKATAQKKGGEQTKQEKEQEAKEKAEKEARREALRRQATDNIAAVVKPLDLTASQSARLKALLSEEQWETAIEAFSTARETEIHEHAHKIAQTTIPGMMRKFMPGYMQGKIFAQRRKARRGPPSRNEIISIQKNAQSKMQPAMRKTVMPALEDLTRKRLDELLDDEKTLTRMLADRLTKGRVFDKTQLKAFSTALEKAGYPQSLTTGEDDTLNDRTEQMLKKIDLREVAKSAGL